MATKQNNKPDQKTEEAAEIKRKLAWRMGIAGLMIVGLLGGLALFDRFSGPGSSSSRLETETPQFTEPVPVQKKMATQPVTPVEPSAEAVKAAEPVVEPESSKAPAHSSGVLSAAPPPPVVSAQPSLPRAGRPAAVASPATSATLAVPEKSAEAKTPSAVVISESPPAASAVPAPAPARLMSGYALQAGVFSDTQHAEELHARLQQAGIPSSIEARVQVGPFKSKAEAEATRKKLNALGIDSVLLPPKKGKR